VLGTLVGGDGVVGGGTDVKRRDLSSTAGGVVLPLMDVFFEGLGAGRLHDGLKGEAVGDPGFRLPHKEGVRLSVLVKNIRLTSQ